MIKNLFHPVSVTLAIALKGTALCAIAAGLSSTSLSLHVHLQNYSQRHNEKVSCDGFLKQ